MQTSARYELPKPKPPEWEAGFYWRDGDASHTPHFLSPEPGVAFYCDAATWRLASSGTKEAFQEGLFVAVPKVTFDQPWAEARNVRWWAGFFLFNDRVYFLAPKFGQAWWLDSNGQWCDSAYEGWTEHFLAQAVPLARIVFEQEEIT